MAFTVYDALGDTRRAFGALVPNLQLGFMKAEEPSVYVAVAQSAMRKAGQASAFGVNDVALQLRVLAADCAYFAAKATAAGRDRDGLLRAALEMLADGADASVATRLSAEWTLRLSTLASVLFGDVTSSFSLVTDDAARSLLRTLARVVEALVPPGFAYPGHEARAAESGSDS